MKGRLLILFALLLLLAVVAGMAAWFLDNFERRSTEVRLGMSAEARRNPLLAGEIFLQRQGLDVKSLSGREYLTKPDADVGVLLVKDLGPSLAPERETALLEWIEAGGHLIVSPGRAPDEDESGNHLLASFGVSLVEYAESDEEESQAGNPVSMEYTGYDEPLQVEFDIRRELMVERDDTDWLVPGLNGYHLVGFQLGRGFLTILSDNRFFTNTRIVEHDHALLLALLTEDQGAVRLLYSANMPSLLTLIWKNAAYAVLSAILLLLLSIWRLTYRSGPILNTGEHARRNLLEHLQAGGEYLWKLDRAVALRERSADIVEKRWLQRHPQLARLDQQQRCSWIGQRSGLSAQTVYETLYVVPVEEQKMIQASANLQRLLAALHPDSRKQM
ncbi:MAG: hypothetical protein OI74_14255 [Gammaproteobacteria bacterium (ex Lamellibrachia satsuma)]|nr:MAG: DUF4350 domain-containing protein [Gammaproteobacteria bacterium (ex Lamellibrachia satsuma)]RRS31508.1 MAG: hypothetical protein OI74_14255 [Gammaproteobacteria bacterium (ex Lamellibrachia satsuma)]RRS35847.1 MAG: hypothetical protein NV67_09325 [Gammaproteobacteria bacterium (ex Lamellibrachia satsuma)]